MRSRAFAGCSHFSPRPTQTSRAPTIRNSRIAVNAPGDFRPALRSPSFRSDAPVSLFRAFRVECRPLPLAFIAYTGSFMKLQSHTITQGRDRAPARAMLKAIGFTDEDLAKPIIGDANTWIETMPCNYNLRELAVKVKEGIRAAGGTPMEFNTIAISDGVTLGTEGMKTSLISREVIADSIELLVRGHMFDGVV